MLQVGGRLDAYYFCCRGSMVVSAKRIDSAESGSASHHTLESCAHIDLVPTTDTEVAGGDHIIPVDTHQPSTHQGLLSKRIVSKCSELTVNLYSMQQYFVCRLITNIPAN